MPGGWGGLVGPEPRHARATPRPSAHGRSAAPGARSFPESMLAPAPSPLSRVASTRTTFTRHGRRWVECVPGWAGWPGSPCGRVPSQRSCCRQVDGHCHSLPSPLLAVSAVAGLHGLQCGLDSQTTWPAAWLVALSPHPSSSSPSSCSWWKCTHGWRTAT